MLRGTSQVSGRDKSSRSKLDKCFFRDIETFGGSKDIKYGSVTSHALKGHADLLAYRLGAGRCLTVFHARRGIGRVGVRSGKAWRGGGEGFLFITRRAKICIPSLHVSG